MRNSRSKSNYLLKIWGASILLYPFFLMLFGLIFPDVMGVSNLLQAVLLILSAAYLSIPTIVVSIIFFKLFTAKISSIQLFQTIHLFIGIIGTLITFKLLPTGSLLNPGEHIFYYSAAIGLSILTSMLLFKVYLAKN